MKLSEMAINTRMLFMLYYLTLNSQVEKNRRVIKNNIQGSVAKAYNFYRAKKKKEQLQVEEKNEA